eukprot:CAMPEP_0198123316 /NCGR_PEP_ID=MMETSP1442-20131203/37212_1 /TAXON_ID= /ORGANISM="Craspedostauros australis, Strain CCMP3328" /LENGTH=308 /DNA_ID=CAMNT_0043782509 /DNA_START=325 /DNA_END=1251 /DNA_ORIENTATION=+
MNVRRTALLLAVVGSIRGFCDCLVPASFSRTRSSNVPSLAFVGSASIAGTAGAATGMAASRSKPGASASQLRSSMDEDVVSDSFAPAQADDATKAETALLKTKLLQMGASYDRGFGASPRARSLMDTLIGDLEDRNLETNAAQGIDGDSATPSPLAGNWRMVWTTASDVLVLGANPLISVGAIYQIFEPPIVTNIIDAIPRIQNLLPPAMVPSSLLRAKVQTRGSSRLGKPMRVGLDFESVKLEPVELLGQDTSGVLPPLGFDLPKLFELPDDVGYFDVTFLDDDMLIIRQNAPGGLFVLSRVDDASP